MITTSSSRRPAIISCDGQYDIKDNKGVLELTFSSQNKGAQCSFPAPQFEIKKTGNNYSIRNDSFSNSPSDQWLQLTKTRDIVCDPTIRHEMDYSNTKTCYYDKKNILQAYKKHLSFEKDSVRNDFIPNIKIGKNQQVKNQGNTISVKYTWKETDIFQPFKNMKEERLKPCLITMEKYQGNNKQFCWLKYPDGIHLRIVDTIRFTGIKCRLHYSIVTIYINS